MALLIDQEDGIGPFIHEVELDADHSPEFLQRIINILYAAMEGIDCKPIKVFMKEKKDVLLGANVVINIAVTYAGLFKQPKKLKPSSP